MARDKKVSYYYDPEIGNYYYGQKHPMKPHRVRMAHCLIARYGLYRHMEIFKPALATEEVMKRFHADDYIEFLKTVTPDALQEDGDSQYGLTDDCPAFVNLFRFCQITTGGSVGGAVRLNYNMSDIVINWAGGLHHAKKAEAAGFCYVNDIVLAILELLKYHARVLYIDIDVHHGDGVEEAFLTTPRVMTVSFHKHGNDFFPGTGELGDVGMDEGRYYAVNVPLKDGIDDLSYESLFKPIMQRVMERFNPDVIVLQSGADSLAGDRLGVFNLSSRGHAQCHRLMRSFNVPMLVLGGGGYKIKNVARCWTYETGVLLGVDEAMDDNLPPNEYYEYFGPDHKLQIHSLTDLAANPNLNKREQLEKIKETILKNLDKVKPEGVAFHERAPDAMDADDVKGVRPDDDDQMILIQ